MPKSPLQAILLMGATATGKTDLAVELVERFPMEIISVDSALIYRGMDIGTAKPGSDLLRRAPHHLIDVIDPSESWSAWQFVNESLMLIESIQARDRIPLLVGGTMMYFHALEQGMHDLPMGDKELRRQLNQRLELEGLGALYDELSVVDPTTAQRLKPGDSQRILRALEVYQLTGKAMSHLLQQPSAPPDIHFRRLILDVPERADLHRRIEQRFGLMLERGFEQEVRELRTRGDLHLDLPSMRCVGYRQIWQFLDGNYDHAEMVHRSVVATRQLAKRQLTWLRKYQQAERVDYRGYALDRVIASLGLSGADG